MSSLLIRSNTASVSVSIKYVKSRCFIFNGRKCIKVFFQINAINIKIKQRQQAKTIQIILRIDENIFGHSNVLNAFIGRKIYLYLRLLWIYN